MLGILAGVIVGIADGLVVWIYNDRLDQGRRDARMKGAEMSKGSGNMDVYEKDGNVEERDGAIDVAKQDHLADKRADKRGGKEEEVENAKGKDGSYEGKKLYRLRRRAVRGVNE